MLGHPAPVPQTGKQGRVQSSFPNRSKRRISDENELCLVRAPGESSSDVILRLASDAKPIEKPAGGSPASSAVLSAPNVRRPTTSLQRRLSGGVETDLEGFVRPSFNATGGASKAMRREIFTVGTPTRHWR